MRKDDRTSGKFAQERVKVHPKKLSGLTKDDINNKNIPPSREVRTRNGNLFQLALCVLARARALATFPCPVIDVSFCFRHLIYRFSSRRSRDVHVFFFFSFSFFLFFLPVLSKCQDLSRLGWVEVMGIQIPAIFGVEKDRV